MSVGKPRSAQRPGTAFNGRGKEKTAELVIPERALASDELWLTVADNSGNIHQQALPTARVSPALARYLETRPAPAAGADEPEAAPDNSPRQRSGARQGGERQDGGSRQGSERQGSERQDGRSRQDGRTTSAATED